MNLIRYIVGTAILVVVNLSNLNNVSAAPSKGGETGNSIGDNFLATRLVSLSSEPNTTSPIIIIETAAVVRPESAFFTDALMNWTQDFEQGREPEMLAPGQLPASPTNYAMFPSDSTIPWYTLVFSQNTPMFAGNLNPTGEFQNERGFGLVRRVTLIAPPGKKVSLSLFSLVTWDSSDKEAGADHGSLYTTNAISNTAYTALARGYNGDQVITFGPGTQECDVVTAFFWDFPYNGGGTQQGLDEVRQYVLVDVPNFTSTFSVVAGGVTASQTLGVKEQILPIPALSITHTGSSARVLVSGASGVLWTTPSLQPTQWVPLANVASGSVYEMDTTGQQQQFFQVVTQ